MTRKTHQALVAAGIAATLATGAFLSPVPAQAQPGPRDNFQRFYETPASLPSTPGALIRKMGLTSHVMVAQHPQQGQKAYPLQGTRIMFTTTRVDNRLTPVTGVVFRHTTEWKHATQRPLIVVTSASLGAGDQCAASRTTDLMLYLGRAYEGSQAAQPMSMAANYLMLTVNKMLNHGYDVMMADYVGQGMDGVHTYMDRVEQGNTMLDSARAALTVLGRDVRTTPVALWGYSQGGGAVASAVELAGTYAPEINLKASYAGGVPANMFDVAKKVDGNLLGGVLGWTAAGMADRHPEVKAFIQKNFTKEGQELISRMTTLCVADLMTQVGPVSTSKYTRSGKPFAQLMEQDPVIRSIILQNLIGTRVPRGKVYLVQNIHDDIIPYPQAKRLYERWKAMGGDVTWHEVSIPAVGENLFLGHFLPLMEPSADAWMYEQLTH